MERLTATEKACLSFAYKYRKGWHGFSGKVKRSLKSLERKGLVLVNDFSQFRISEQGKVYAYRNI